MGQRDGGGAGWMLEARQWDFARGGVEDGFWELVEGWWTGGGVIIVLLLAGFGANSTRPIHSFCVRLVLKGVRCACACACACGVRVCESVRVRHSNLKQHPFRSLQNLMHARVDQPPRPMPSRRTLLYPTKQAQWLPELVLPLVTFRQVFGAFPYWPCSCQWHCGTNKAP